jgi:hypothetical protein
VLPLAAVGQAGSLGREIVSRAVGIPELVGSLAGVRRPKRLRLSVQVLRAAGGGPVVSEAEVQTALAETRRVLEREANVRLEAGGAKLIVTREDSAPVEALDSPCTDQGLWKADLGAAGRYFRPLKLRGSVGRGAPLTVFVVRDVVGKCGCSLGPLGDYVTIDRQGLGGTRRILAHELGHSCGLRHVSGEENLMRARNPGERLTRWQRAVLRSSRHVTYL